MPRSIIKLDRNAAISSKFAIFYGCEGAPHKFKETVYDHLASDMGISEVQVTVWSHFIQIEFPTEHLRLVTNYLYDDEVLSNPSM